MWMLAHTHNDHYNRRQNRPIQFMDHFLSEKKKIFSSSMSFTLLHNSWIANSRIARANVSLWGLWTRTHKNMFPINICFHCVRYPLKLCSPVDCNSSNCSSNGSDSNNNNKNEIMYADFNYIFTWHAISYAIKTRTHTEKCCNATMMCLRLCLYGVISVLWSFRIRILCTLRVGASKQELQLVTSSINDT